jgi:hypothetical protein
MKVENSAISLFVAKLVDIVDVLIPLMQSPCNNHIVGWGTNGVGFFMRNYTKRRFYHVTLNTATSTHS